MQNDRTGFELLLYSFKLLYHTGKVIAIVHAVVVKAEFFKYLHAALFVVAFLGIARKVVEIFVHTADRWRNRHSVIVYDYQYIGVQRPEAVERLVDKTVIERTVAYYGYDVKIFACKVARLGYSQGGGNGSPCVTCVVTVVFALFALGKARKPAFLPQCGKSAEAA